jgi:hypothetical protein
MMSTAATEMGTTTTTTMMLSEYVYVGENPSEVVLILDVIHLMMIWSVSV